MLSGFQNNMDFSMFMCFANYHMIQTLKIVVKQCGYIFHYLYIKELWHKTIVKTMWIFV